MKKILNSPEVAVTDYLEGLSLAFPNFVTFDADTRIVRRSSPLPRPKVGLISGGGSGCEPMHAGFVGVGGLDAACPGEIFTSPVPAQIMAATRIADSGMGVLYIIKNYGGEVMNFGLSAEILRSEGIAISKLIVNDDCSFPDGQENLRRGLGATILVEKICGASAERGDDLDTVTRFGELVVKNSRSFGIALNSCTTPKLGKPTFDMPHEKMDLGVGLGGDRGQQQINMEKADVIAKLMVDRPFRELGLTVGCPVILFLSSLGSLPQMELFTLSGAIQRELISRGVNIVRVMVGEFMTSLDTHGASMTIMSIEADLLDLFDAPIATQALRWGV